MNFKPITIEGIVIFMIKSESRCASNRFQTLVKTAIKVIQSPVKAIHEIPLSASCSNRVQSIQGLGKVREDWTTAY